MRTRAAAYSVVGGWLLPVWLWLSTAAAEEPALLTHYDGPASCPDAQQFTQRVRARLKSQTAGTLSVRIHEVDQQVWGSIALTGGAERSVQAVSCDALIEPLSLIGALLLEASPPPPRPIRRRAPLVQEPPAPPAEIAAPPAHVETVPSPSHEVTAERSPSVSTRNAPHERHLSAFAAGGLATGITPSARPLLSVGATYHVRLRSFVFGARLGLRTLWPYRARLPEGRASLRWWSVLLTSCLEQPLGRFSWGGCAALELGRTFAQGSHTERPRSAGRTWAAAGPGLFSSLQLTRQIALQLSGEALLPFERHRYQLADRLVHDVPPVTIRAEFALVVRIW